MTDRNPHRPAPATSSISAFLWLLLLLAGLMLSGCGNQNNASEGINVSDPPVLSTPALQEVAPGENQSSAESSTAADPTERVRFAGITFVYPTAQVREVIAEQEALDDQSAGSGIVPPPVRFSFLIEDPVEPADAPVLTIQAVRGTEGAFYPGVSDADRRRVAELEASLQSIASQSENTNAAPLAFVNGSGIRLVTTEESGTSYRFQGLTGDGRYLLDMRFPMKGDSASITALTEQLDQLAMTIFVDGAAEALNVTTCVDDADLVTDVTIPDGTEIDPGATFIKTWRMRNTGSCTWTANYSWTFKGGDVLTLLETSDIDQVAPGEEVDISVTLQAPESPGNYAGQWQLSGTNQFEGIGPEVYFSIRVPDSP